MSYTFNRQAVEVKQGSLTLYLTYITPLDLTHADVDFYSTEMLDPDKPVDRRGFNRLINEKRINDIARYVSEAKAEGPNQHYLPTAIMLATDGSAEYKDGVVSIPAASFPLIIVDGQHRLKGILAAFEKDTALANYQLPAVITTGLTHDGRKLEFIKVNMKQVALDTSMRQQTVSDLYERRGFEDMPYIPFWLQREVALGTDYQAILISNKLNDAPASPLKGRIRKTNQDNRGASGKRGGTHNTPIIRC